MCCIIVLPAVAADCFPASATVEREDGKRIRMDALKVGDKIRVGLNDYSDVFMFSHQFSSSDTHTSFLELSTDSGTLRLTPGHYLYVNGNITQAGRVKLNDFLETVDSFRARVNGIWYLLDRGLFNPHTLHGDIIVNGFRTTTYTDAIHPTMAHALLAPLRALYKGYSPNVSLGF